MGLCLFWFSKEIGNELGETGGMLDLRPVAGITLSSRP
jgi:hypothetical protein